MAFIGLKHPVFAPINTEPNGALPTYGPGIIVGYAMAANVSITRSDSKLIADDRVVEVDDSFQSGKITVGLDDLSDDSRVAWLGDKEVTVGLNTAIRSAGKYSSPYGGFGYYRIRKKNNILTYQGFWYYKTKFATPAEDAKTKGENIEWQTPSVEGIIFCVDDVDNSWRDIVTFTTEAEAVDWLDTLAGIV